MGPVCCQCALCHINWSTFKTPKILLVTPVSKPSAHLYDFHVSCPNILCDWQDRTEHNLCSRSWPVVPRSGGTSWPSTAFLVGLHQYPLGKPVVGNDQWAIPAWEFYWWWLWPRSQGGNTSPCRLGPVGPPFCLKLSHQWLLSFCFFLIEVVMMRGIGHATQAFSILKQLIFYSWILFEFSWYCAHSESLWTCTSTLDFNNVNLFSFVVHPISKFWSSF